MSRISDILVKVRDTLADHAKQRWSDPMLLRILDEGQKDIAFHTRILKGTYTFNPQPGIAEYTLPDNVWIITRASFDDSRINLVTYDTMDEMADKGVSILFRYNGDTIYDFSSAARLDWDSVESNVIEALVYDNRNVENIRVYPIPNVDFSEFDYTFSNAGTAEYIGDDVLGVVTAIDDYTLSSDFGVVSALYDPGVTIETFSSVFGVVTSIAESDHFLKIWYIRKPDTIVAVDDELEINASCDTALRLYIIGNAFLNDNDAAFASKAKDFLGLYDREIGILSNASSRDNVSNPRATETSYIGPFQ